MVEERWKESENFCRIKVSSHQKLKLNLTLDFLDLYSVYAKLNPVGCNCEG
jgi:hypothetical protein